MEAIPVSKLHLVSAFERAEVVIQGPIPVARLRNVLYQPNALGLGQGLQIFEDGAIPLEASYYDYVVDFSREQLIHQGISSLPTPNSSFDYANVQGDVCILANLFSRNFTHWHEELLKVVVIQASEISCTYILSQLPPFARELLSLIGIPPDHILEVNRPLRFSSLLFPAAISYDNICEHPTVFHLLTDRLMKAISDKPSNDSQRRLWLERGAQTRLGRQLVNEKEVHLILEKQDVKRVDLGKLPVIQQLSLARDAELIAGLHGSAFVHSQMMLPGSSVVECFSPLYLNPTYTNIYRLQRHRYSLVVGTHSKLFPYPYGEDVCVDLPQLELALDTASHG